MTIKTDFVSKHPVSSKRSRISRTSETAEIWPWSATDPGALTTMGDDWAVCLTSLAGLTDGHGSSADPLRCWVPACGNGELAYSIAILLAETFGRESYHRRFKIFATGSEEASLAKARRGLFPEATFDHLPGSRPYLRRDRKLCKITPSIREMIVFSKHDPMRDPPISKLDLICCDRLLHRLDRPTQERFIPIFHHILNPGGYLWIGGTEAIQGLDDWFEPLNGRSPIRVRRDRERRPAEDLYGMNFQAWSHGPSLAKRGDLPCQLECDNEELQTSIEELRRVIDEKSCVNEELNLVNQELHARSDELNATLEQLAASEARFRSVVEDQSELICRYLPDGTITFVNTAFAQALKASKADLLGESFADFLPNEMTLQSRLAGLTPDSPVRTFDCRVTTSSNEKISWQHWTDRALFDQDGQVVEYQSVGEDISVRVEAEERYHYLAVHDQLTGLLNRHGFFERLASVLTSARHLSKPIAIHYLDLDHFKHVNDALGHAVGDALLRSVADRLENTVRSRDIVARLGGDEFAVVQTSIRDVNDVAGLAKRLLAAVQTHHDVDNHQIRTSTTIGISMFPEDGSEANALLGKADLAMYECKKHGGQRYGFFTQGLNQQMAAQYQLQTELSAALDDGQFEVYYQPLINLATHRISAVEALLRWHHPTRGLLETGEFIGALEASGEIVRVGQWVLETACRQARGWLEQAGDDVRLNVNLSARTLKEANLTENVRCMLDQLDFDPARLELEITEHAVIDIGLEEAAALLRSLRDLGIRIALDDFGTGYSSLTLLRSLPVSHIKIDRCFVAGLNTSTEDRAIVDAVINLGKSLSLGITAEGVEEQNISTYLEEKGCDEAQGYLYGTAMPADAIADLVSHDLDNGAAGTDFHRGDRRRTGG